MNEVSAESKVFYYPNKMGRIILLALEEVLGRTGLYAVLNVAGLQHLISGYPPNNFDPGFPFEELSAINQSLEDMYGPRGGRGVALRAGRASLKYGLRDFGPIMQTSELSFRLLPLNMKLKVGTEVFAETFVDFKRRLWQMGFRVPMAASYMNGFFWYLAPARAFPEGGMEVGRARAAGLREDMQAVMWAALEGIIHSRAFASGPP